MNEYNESQDGFNCMNDHCTLEVYTDSVQVQFNGSKFHSSYGKKIFYNHLIQYNLYQSIYVPILCTSLVQREFYAIFVDLSMKVQKLIFIDKTARKSI